MLEDPPEDSNDGALSALANSLCEIRDGLVTLSLLLQDVIFEREAERLALQDNHPDPGSFEGVRVDDAPPSESTRDQATDTGGQSRPGRHIDPTKHHGTGAS